LNKRDLVTEEMVERLAARYNGIAISAHTAATLGEMIRRIDTMIRPLFVPEEEIQPYR
jgi:50S ribosomal subunit-associated GTPase HflX